MAEILRQIASSVSKLRALLADVKKDVHRIDELQFSLQDVLKELWRDPKVQELQQNRSLWAELCQVTASGKIISVAAQADTVLSQSKQVHDHTWTGDAVKYAQWLGSGIVELSAQLLKSKNERWQPIADLYSRALSFSHADRLVDTIGCSSLRDDDERSLQAYTKLLSSLAPFDQRRLLFLLLDLLSNRYLPSRPTLEWQSKHTADEERRLAGAKYWLQVHFDNMGASAASDTCLWLMKAGNASTLLYEAVIAALPDGTARDLLEQTWTTFADSLYIRHTPVALQEGYLRLLLIAAGRVHRTSPENVFELARASSHNSSVSNRLSSTSPRIRFFGTVSAVAISKLVDDAEHAFKFDFDGKEADEAEWLVQLTQKEVKKGTRADAMFLFNLGDKLDAQPKAEIKLPLRADVPPKKKASTSKPLISVLDDDDDFSKDSIDDGGIVAYDRPESDGEASESDEAVADSKKAKAPVYIRDLIEALRDSENYARFKLALAAGASLIRRKANFGNEVRDRLEELGGIYISLQDPYDIPDFHKSQLEGLMALLVADPERVGPWYAKMCFGGDYSTQQRANILTAMGLGSRVVAGLEKDIDGEDSFPSKKLPPKLHARYIESARINALTLDYERNLITPTSQSSSSRTKALSNNKGSLIANGIFSPLVGQFDSFHASRPAGFTKDLLPLYIKTLSIILASIGPAAGLMQRTTSEFWELLLSLRTALVESTAMSEALLVGFLSVLNSINDNRRIAQDHARELLETQSWAITVFEWAVEGDEESNRIKALSAGLLTAIKEIVDAHHRLMAGHLGGSDFV